MTRAKPGMTIDEVRQVWIPSAEAKTNAIMESYRARREQSGGGYGHEGLGVYGMYQERAAREKVRLAATLLAQAGLEVTYETIRKVTGQASNTIRSYWAPPKPIVAEDLRTEVEHDRARIIRFPFGSQPG